MMYNICSVEAVVPRQTKLFAGIGSRKKSKVITSRDYAFYAVILCKTQNEIPVGKISLNIKISRSVT